MALGSNSKNSAENKRIWSVRNGDKKVFSEIYQQFFGELCDFAYLMVKDKQWARDVVQDVFLSIWKNRSFWEPKGSIKSYLFKSVKNTALDFIKHQKVVQKWQKNNQGFEEEKNKIVQPDHKIKEQDYTSAIENAIEELPEQQRMVFLMSRKQGLTYHEIATVLDISTKTVETHMGRALKKLRILLKDVIEDYFS